MDREKYLLILLILLFVSVNYTFINSFLINTFGEGEKGIVERVIDGDTIVVDGEKVRLLGVNAPEKGEPFYDEAKEYLKNQILEKEVLLLGNENDLYKRKLRYIFLNGRNINLELIKQGLANPYFPEGNDKYKKSFFDSWQNCLNENKNLCEHINFSCLTLSKWDIKSQEVILRDTCQESLNLSGWSVKDEGRKKFVFGNFILNPGEEVVLTPENWSKSYVWTKTGDSIFVRDDSNLLVIYDHY